VGHVIPIGRVPEQAGAHDRRTAPVVGRDARLELVFGMSRGRTVLVHGYAEPPFRLSRPFERPDELHLILTSSGPGIFGGDCLRQTVRVERGARVRLTSQAAVQVHPDIDDRASSLVSRFDVADGARLTCQWLPLIPFAGARFDQRIVIDVAATGELYWSDAFMAGRSGSGERWRFIRFGHELRIVRAGVLEYLERHEIDPTTAPLANRWIAADEAYFGSTIASGIVWPRETVEALHSTLVSRGTVRAAVDVLGPRLCVTRLTSSSGPAFHAARAVIDRTLAFNPNL